MATDKNYPIDLPILVIEAQIFVAVKKFPFLPNKQIPSADLDCVELPPPEVGGKQGVIVAHSVEVVR